MASSFLMGVPDTGRIGSKTPFPKLAGDTLTLFRPQAYIVMDIPGFLFLVTLEYLNDLGFSFHARIISQRSP
jgi:hypothetical protein